MVKESSRVSLFVFRSASAPRWPPSSRGSSAPCCAARAAATRTIPSKPFLSFPSPSHSISTDGSPASSSPSPVLRRSTSLGFVLGCRSRATWRTCSKRGAQQPSNKLHDLTSNYISYHIFNEVSLNVWFLKRYICSIRIYLWYDVSNLSGVQLGFKAMGPELTSATACNGKRRGKHMCNLSISS